MVTIEIDAHKRTHTDVGVEGAGRQLAERTVPATPSGHRDLLRWARCWRERTWLWRTAATSRVGLKSTCLELGSGLCASRPS